MSLSWLADELSHLEDLGLRRRRRECRPLPHGRVRVDGRDLVNLASNDYLGLAGDARVVSAGTPLADVGFGARASALVSGRTPELARLEDELARFEDAEATMVFPTGFAANMGVVAALAGEEDLVLVDRLDHACLIDGARLSGATLRVYRHTRLEKLDAEFAKHSGGRRFLITDGVFSMDGHLAPLPELAEIAEHHDAVLIVDEAHGTGVFGDTGRGACEQLGVEGDRLIKTGTLSKAAGCLGGFVSGSQTLIDYLWNHARPAMFSTALPPAVCCAATAAIQIIRAEPQRRHRVHALADRLRDQLRSAGWDVPPSEGPIIPIVLGDPNRTLDAARRLEEHGFLVGAIRPPTVPQGTSRLRISVTAVHSETDLDPLVDALG